MLGFRSIKSSSRPNFLGRSVNVIESPNKTRDAVARVPSINLSQYVCRQDLPPDSKDEKLGYSLASQTVAESIFQRNCLNYELIDLSNPRSCSLPNRVYGFYILKKKILGFFRVSHIFRIFSVFSDFSDFFRFFRFFRFFSDFSGFLDSFQIFRIFLDFFRFFQIFWIF